MGKLFYSFILSIGAIIPAVCQSQEVLPDSTVNLLKAAVKGFKDRYQSPSVVLAIVHDQKIIFGDAAGYVDLENKIPATIDSKYPILSVTKTFTATMFMQLKQRNLVGLEDNVKKYVPEFRGGSDDSKNSGTTLLQLATHTSGLPRNTQADIHFTKQIDTWVLGNAKNTTIEPATHKEFLSSLKYIRTEYPKYHLLSYGDRHYSNLGYSLLGLALERAAKTGYASFIMKNICQPLRMNNSGFLTDDIDPKLVAKGYYYHDSLKTFIKTPFFKPNSAMAAGGMYSTATDLAKFISFQFDNGSAEAQKVLSNDYKAMMQVFNIGWKPSAPYVLHEGSMLGYRCQIAFNPELKFGWVILTNTSNFEFSAFNKYIVNLMTPVFDKKAVSDLNKYTGTYQLAGGYGSLNIYLKDDRLYSTYLEDTLAKTPLVPLGNNKFKAQANGSYSIGYDFLPGENSEIKVLNMGQLMWVKE